MNRKLRRSLLSVALVLGLLGGATTAAAHDHDPQRSGHPLRIVAYFLHPVGVVLDTLIFRPAHWVVMHEPFRTLVGHTDRD